MQIAHCGLDVGVAHPSLHLDDARNIDREAAEGVPQVVDTQAPQPRCSERGVVPAPQRRAIKRPVIAADEDEVNPVCMVVALLEFVEGDGDLLDHGHRARLP